MTGRDYVPDLLRDAVRSYNPLIKQPSRNQAPVWKYPTLRLLKRPLRAQTLSSPPPNLLRLKEINEEPGDILLFFTVAGALNKCWSGGRKRVRELPRLEPKRQKDRLLHLPATGTVALKSDLSARHY
jgi:hypothetical protein